MRIEIGGQKYAKAKYDRKCLGLTKEEIEEKKANGESYVIRMKVPKGKTIWKDIVHGKITIDNKEVDDQVILKNDGFPTYHFACVVDDYLMRISHVIRGEVRLESDYFDTLYSHFIHLCFLGMAAIDAKAHTALQNALDRAARVRAFTFAVEQ